MNSIKSVALSLIVTALYFFQTLLLIHTDLFLQPSYFFLHFIIFFCVYEKAIQPCRLKTFFLLFVYFHQVFYLFSQFTVLFFQLVGFPLIHLVRFFPGFIGDQFLSIKVGLFFVNIALFIGILQLHKAGLIRFPLPKTFLINFNSNFPLLGIRQQIELIFKQKIHFLQLIIFLIYPRMIAFGIFLLLFGRVILFPMLKILEMCSLGHS